MDISRIELFGTSPSHLLRYNSNDFLHNISFLFVFCDSINDQVSVCDYDFASEVFTLSLSINKDDIVLLNSLECIFLSDHTTLLSLVSLSVPTVLDNMPNIYSTAEIKDLLSLELVYWEEMFSSSVRFSIVVNGETVVFSVDKEKLNLIISNIIIVRYNGEINILNLFRVTCYYPNDILGSTNWLIKTLKDETFLYLSPRSHISISNRMLMENMLSDEFKFGKSLSQLPLIKEDLANLFWIPNKGNILQISTCPMSYSHPKLYKNIHSYTDAKLCIDSISNEVEEILNTSCGSIILPINFLDALNILLLESICKRIRYTDVRIVIFSPVFLKMLKINNIFFNEVLNTNSYSNDICEIGSENIETCIKLGKIMVFENVTEYSKYKEIRNGMNDIFVITHAFYFLRRESLELQLIKEMKSKQETTLFLTENLQEDCLAHMLEWLDPFDMNIVYSPLEPGVDMISLDSLMKIMRPLNWITDLKEVEYNRLQMHLNTKIFLINFNNKTIVLGKPNEKYLDVLLDEDILKNLKITNYLFLNHESIPLKDAENLVLGEVEGIIEIYNNELTITKMTLARTHTKNNTSSFFTAQRERNWTEYEIADFDIQKDDIVQYMISNGYFYSVSEIENFIDIPLMGSKFFMEGDKVVRVIINYASIDTLTRVINSILLFKTR